LNQLAVVPPDSTDVTRKSPPKRTLVLASLAHALHDGFTDMMYVLLPVWQAEFALDYVALAALRALYVGVLAALQVPSAHLARHLNARTVLQLGTLLSAAGYALAGLSGGLVGLCASLALAAAGPIWATVAAAPTAVAVVPLMLLLSPPLARSAQKRSLTSSTPPVL
jgi:hypothetical protein